MAELDALGLSARPSVFRRGTIACTGIEFCKLAIVETKVTAATAVAELERRLADLAESKQLPQALSLHINGCPNSCARIQTADIGLKGMMLPTPDGDPTPGFQVHLGGGLASDSREEAGLGRTVRGLKVTSRTCPTTWSAWSASSSPTAPRARPSPSGPSPPRRGTLQMTARPALRTHDELKALAEAGAAELGWDAPARDVIAWVARNFELPAVAVACSMADAVLPALVADQLPGVDVLFLETGYHFPETLRHARRGRREPARQRRGRAAGEHRGAAGPAPGQGPLRPRPRPVLRPAQGGPAAPHPRRLRTLVHRRPPRRGPHPHQHAAGHLGRSQRPGQGQPGGGLDASTSWCSTPTTTSFPSTRCFPRATRPLAASPAPARWRPATTPAPAAGQEPTRQNADYTYEHLNHQRGPGAASAGSEADPPKRPSRAGRGC